MKKKCEKLNEKLKKKIEIDFELNPKHSYIYKRGNPNKQLIQMECCKNEYIFEYQREQRNYNKQKLRNI